MQWPSRQVSIRGIFVPVDWDQNGNATRVALMAAHEEEYLIERFRNKEKLLGLIRREAALRGLVGEEAGQNFLLERR